MQIYEERVLFADGALAELTLEPGGRYRLRYTRPGGPLVEYRGDRAAHRRRSGERERGYEFRSVEQLRYDFERDVEEAQRPG